MGFKTSLKRIGQYHDPVQMGKMAKSQHDRGVDWTTALHDPPGKITGTQPGKGMTKKEYAAKKKKKRDSAYERYAAAQGMKKGGKVQKCGVGGYYRKAR